MRKTITTLTLSAIALCLVLSSCKKDDTTSTADEIVGTYIVNDTIPSNLCFAIEQYDQFTITITKKNDNTVIIKNFDHCNDDLEATVTSSTVIGTSGELCAFDNANGTRKGNNISFTFTYYPGSCAAITAHGTATKQQ